MGNIRSLVVLALVSGSSAALAQPTHAVTACVDVPLNGHCRINSMMAPPDASNPLQIDATANYPGDIGSYFNYEVSSTISSSTPGDWVGTTSASISVRGTSLSGDTSAEMSITNETFTITRLDQPPAPGETVDVVFQLEYRFAYSASTTDEFATATISFEYGIYFAEAVRAFQDGIGYAMFTGQHDFDSGWTPTTSLTDTLPVGVPIDFDLIVNTDVRSYLATCGNCSYKHLGNNAIIEWRFAPQPFLFIGPGTYTADAPQLLIVDNTYPATVASCPADLNHDGVLDLLDIIQFTTGFGTQDPAADIDGNGIWDLDDVILFVGYFNAGCP